MNLIYICGILSVREIDYIVGMVEEGAITSNRGQG